MSLAFLVCALVPQLHGAEGDEVRDFLWPLGSGYSPYELRATYGQPQNKGRRLHDGLDVSTTNVVLGGQTRSVYALEDGVVKRVHVDDVENYVSGLVVASKAVPGRAFLYLHLEKGSLRFAAGEEVLKNQIVGDVVLVDSSTNVPHVHLSRLGGDFANEPWSSIGSLSERNPLALLKPGALGDTTAPAIETIDGEDFRFCDDEGSCSDGHARLAIPASTGGQPRPMDVLASVIDSDGGPHRLAPYKLKLTLKNGSEQTFWLCLDGPLPKAAVFCRREKRGPPPPPRYDDYFVLTNGAADCGSRSDAGNAWQASVGQHALELSLEDVAGMAFSTSTVVEVQGP